MYTLTIIIFILLLDKFYADHKNRKERKHYLDFIDRLQNKLMAKNLGEYESYSRPSGRVTNPLMDNIKNNYKARGGDE